MEYPMDDFEYMDGTHILFSMKKKPVSLLPCVSKVYFFPWNFRPFGWNSSVFHTGVQKRNGMAHYLELILLLVEPTIYFPNHPNRRPKPSKP